MNRRITPMVVMMLAVIGMNFALWNQHFEKGEPNLILLYIFLGGTLVFVWFGIALIQANRRRWDNAQVN